jgi:hypothetical protein
MATVMKWVCLAILIIVVLDMAEAQNNKNNNNKNNRKVSILIYLCKDSLLELL